MTWLYITKIAISKWYLSAMLSSCVVVQPLMQYSQKSISTTILWKGETLIDLLRSVQTFKISTMNDI